MRRVWTDIGTYKTLREARAAKRRAIARCEILRKPEACIFKRREGSFFLEGALIVRSPVGQPVKPPKKKKDQQIGVIRGRRA